MIDLQAFCHTSNSEHLQLALPAAVTRGVSKDSKQVRVHGVESKGEDCDLLDILITRLLMVTLIAPCSNGLTSPDSHLIQVKHSVSEHERGGTQKNASNKSTLSGRMLELSSNTGAGAATCQHVSPVSRRPSESQDLKEYRQPMLAES